MNPHAIGALGATAMLALATGPAVSHVASDTNDAILQAGLVRKSI